MSKYFIANFIFFQFLWFSCVLAAGAYQMHWLAFAAIVPISILTWFSPYRTTDFLVAMVAVCTGLMIDNLWVALDILEYPRNSWAPYWIAILWYGLGLTVNHSMAWFRDHMPWGAIIVGAAAPVTYLSAERFGAVDVASLLPLSAISLSWLILFYGLARFSLWLIDAQINPLNSQAIDSPTKRSLS